MSSAFSLTFAASKGEQVPESLSGAAKDVPVLVVGGNEVPLTFTLSATVAGEESLELRAIS